MAGFEFPKEAKTLAMLPEQGTGFEDQKCVFPVLNTTGEPDAPEALGSSEARFFDLAVNAKRDQLLSQESILGEELGFTSWQIRCYGESNRMTSGLGEMKENTFER